MLTKRITLIVALIVAFSCFSSTVNAVDPRTTYLEYQINPKGTYLRTCQDNPGITIIPIGDPNPVGPGDWVVLRAAGTFQAKPGWGDNRYDLIGVFSAYGTLHPDEVNIPNRLKDTKEIPSGYGWETKGTYWECVEEEGGEADNLSTDIPQDFYIGADLLQIPSGAKYLYTTTNSDYHGDNSDPNGDFKIRFTDEIRWAGRASDNSWFTGSNWDTWIYPTGESSKFGFSFDEHGDTSVSGANANIRYLRIVEGIVRFDAGTNLGTTVCGTGKIPFLVGDNDGAKMYLTGGRLTTCQARIGYEGKGELNIFAGGYVEVDKGIVIGAEKGSPGTIFVHGEDSRIFAGNIWVGWSDRGSLLIYEFGYVTSTSLIMIGGGIDDSRGIVNVGSNGQLYAYDKIEIRNDGILMINGGGVEPTNGIHVKEGGTIFGCNSGYVTGEVINQGGTVAPGCSTGKLIINGNYIQESAGTLAMEVGGYNKGEDYDVLEVTGNVTLNGTLQVNFVNGFAPKQGDVFEFTNVTGSVSQNLSKVETNCVADDFQHKTELVGGKLTMTALNDARPIPCGGPKAMPWIPLLLLDE